MNPNIEKDIRARAAELIDADYVDPQIVVHAALDRHTLLIEVDMLRVVLKFMLENCMVATGATAETAGLPLKQQMVLTGLLDVMQENVDKRQTDAAAAIADRAEEEKKDDDFFGVSLREIFEPTAGGSLREILPPTTIDGVSVLPVAPISTHNGFREHLGLEPKVD